RIGKYLRRSSIDELPQLINVLKGDMSLVGPRPNVLSQKELYQPQDWDKRNTVLPGITGLAQASIRSDGTPEQRLELDLFYVNNMSFLFDMKIILMTIKQIIKKGGN
ncbi:sugar transferase, partial [Morganella morganii]|nr:sugar transferase [Morganella morganii]EKU8062849.1 sugar transferase [Morganella morganii]